MANSNIRYRLLNGFDDLSVSPEIWNELLAKGSSDVIFMTWHWQKAWWETFGRGELLLIVAESNSKPIAIAPLFAEYGMIYFVGSGGSDYLDFIGDVSNADVLEGILAFAAAQVPDFCGFQFFHILENSNSAKFLAAAAKRQGWKIYDEGGWNCPMLELFKFPEKAVQATRKKSLLRHEAYFKRNGEIEIEHLTKKEEILPHLESFFAQHIARWNPTRFPSLFLDDKQQNFYRRFTELASEANWLRFSRVVWNKRSIAFHFGFNYKGSFLWYKPSFDISLAKHSPGEVLLRQLLLQAIEEDADTFDFGLGDEAFKERFATNSRAVKIWGLYKQTAKNVLVVSPHPDDESIGCGGTIRKHIVDGDTVEVVFLTSGERGGHKKSQNQISEIRERESAAAAGILQISKINFWRESDGDFQTTETNISRLTAKIKEFQPDVIYVPHEDEDHSDHRAAALLVSQAINSLPESVKKPVVWMFEVWTPLQKIDHIVDISPFVEIKRQAILAYKSQCDVVRFDEAILGLNRYRGELYNWQGGEYAEIFKKLV